MTQQLAHRRVTPRYKHSDYMKNWKHHADSGTTVMAVS